MREALLPSSKEARGKHLFCLMGSLPEKGGKEHYGGNYRVVRHPFRRV